MEWTRGPIIGRGSTATVSLATATSSDEPFVVKSTELSKSMLLQKEQYFLSKLGSPYVVKYLGYEITNENNELMYNISMEYAPGGTLFDAIERHGGQLDESTIRSYTRNIVKGLDYLHANGLAHCDIKGQNVLITKGGAKIADLGCAKFVRESAASNGGFSGTPAFMSPEVARGEEQGFAADVWAVGCTVIEMATGKTPWAEHCDEPFSALFKIGFSDEVPEFPSWFSEMGKDFLSKCLRRDPRQRWTAKELLHHSFLDVQDFIMTSPSCVLDQDFWDSMEGLEMPQDFSFSNSNLSNFKSPAERIQSLIGSTFSRDWNWDEDWITVRNSEIVEKEVVLVDSPSASWASDSIGSEELESSSFDRDLLLVMEFFQENQNRICDGNFRTSEHCDYAFENLNFETDNDEILIYSIDLFFFLFIPWFQRLLTTLLIFH